MSDSNNSGCGQLIYLIMAVFTAIIGWNVHLVQGSGTLGNIFWCLVNVMFWPIAWIKWIICNEVSVSFIKGVFENFLS